VDAQTGTTASDLDTADLLRRSGKPVLLAANKADNARMEERALEFYELGLGDPLPVSAYHGRGTADLLDRIIALLPPQPPPEPAVEGMKLAIAGRPNVGKSLLLNALVGDSRSIVDNAPGTTRDAIDTPFDFKGQNIILIDTAGIRRRGRIDAGVERYSVLRALRAIDRADVALLVIDAAEGVTAGDTHIAGYIQQAAKGIVIVVNKWDLVADKNTLEWSAYIQDQFKFMPYAPVLFASAKTGLGVNKILPRALEVYRERQKRLSTPVVNDVVQEAVASHAPPRSGRKHLKVLYATQAETSPPTFVFFVNDAKLLHFSYRRYLENKLRQAFGFEGTPLRLVLKTRGEK
jgi:GTP-binding protein